MDRKLQRHRADSLRQHGFLVLISVMIYSYRYSIRACRVVEFQLSLSFCRCRYDAKFETLNRNSGDVRIVGYFQSWKYFDFVSSCVLREFNFLPEFQRTAYEFLQDVADEYKYMFYMLYTADLISSNYCCRFERLLCIWDFFLLHTACGSRHAWSNGRGEGWGLRCITATLVLLKRTPPPSPRENAHAGSALCVVSTCKAYREL